MSPALSAAIQNAIAAFLKWVASWIPQPAPTPNPVPSPKPPTSKLSANATVILNFNNGRVPPQGFSIPAEGVTLHAISGAQAQATANELDKAVAPNIPLGVPYALLASESDFDPFCVNENIGPGRSNTTNTPWDYDCGVAQLKLGYISQGGKSGAAAFATVQDAQAFAFDVTRAIPYFLGLYESHLATADAWIAGGGPSTIDPRLMNRYILATVIYKQGMTGAETIFKSGVWPAELNNFIAEEGQFASLLGVQSVFANL